MNIGWQTNLLQAEPKVVPGSPLKKMYSLAKKTKAFRSNFAIHALNDFEGNRSGSRIPLSFKALSLQIE